MPVGTPAPATATAQAPAQQQAAPATSPACARARVPALAKAPASAHFPAQDAGPAPKNRQGQLNGTRCGESCFAAQATIRANNAHCIRHPLARFPYFGIWFDGVYRGLVVWEGLQGVFKDRVGVGFRFDRGE